MNKFVAKLATCILAISILTAPSAEAAAFTDLPENHKNYTAIVYLQENGILKGYNDGTFRPDNTVNRAEFLKIILEGSDIALDITTATPFNDVDHNEWYGPYIKKAYHENWINGYGDGTFKPSQTINKVEALKILAAVQQWQLETPATQPFTDTAITEWFTPYISYAKTHGYLEEQTHYFLPGKIMTRAKISEIIYRTTTIETIAIYAAPDTTTDNESGNTSDTTQETDTEVTADTDNEPTPEENPDTDSETEIGPTTSQDSSTDQDINFTPENFREISSDFFTTIVLDETLPNTFYKDEIYLISGQINNSYEKATVILEGITDSNYSETFSAEIENNTVAIPVHFTQQGNYNIGIIPGESGTGKATTISVLADFENSTVSTTAASVTAFDINFANDKTFVTFSAPQSTLKKVTFSQDNKNATYYSRQNQSKLTIDYRDFEEFTKGNTMYQVQAARIESEKPLKITSDFSQTTPKTFTATEHSFSAIEDSISTTPPEMLASVSGITFSGTISTDTDIEAYAIRPDGFVDTFELSTTSPTSTYQSNTIINSGGNFTFTYNPTSSGRYILEINDKYGLPILNHPVYIGGAIPLIPDYLDLHQREFFEGTIDLANFRTELLGLINDSREEHGLTPIELASDINVIAQNHAEDMAENNYFAHVSPAGQSPDDRRIAAGITTAVSENIAKDTSILFGHLGLMRSASHRSNILTPEWTRVGLGIAQSDGHLIIAEEFSINAITDIDLANFKNELYTEINNLRTTPLATRDTLESATDYLNDKKIIEGQELTNELFSEALNIYNITGSSSAIGRSHNTWTQILNSIITDESNNIQQGNWQSIGADIQLDSIGIIHTMVILNSGT